MSDHCLLHYRYKPGCQDCLSARQEAAQSSLAQAPGSLPAVECGACGERSRMRVDAHQHPIDRCPKCKAEGFMHIPENETGLARREKE